MNITKAALAIGIFSMVGACVPTAHSIYWKSGKTYQQRQNDFTNCEVEAVRKVPVAQAVGVTPVYHTPAYTTPIQTSCYGTGYYASCTSTGGQVYGGQTYGGDVYTYDANSDLRDRVAMQCMSNRGYQKITVPVCDAEQKKLAVSAKSGRSPAASQVVCITADKSGYVLTN
ncbi:hypothetical protein SAMN05421762_2010 [Pseudooceanicola nitratireducens]|mgnify:CR=1 FL=1|jgi:hypothetical protein|uniref:Uncharacterized protein n=1 Tax=Pseudooceanicola nitratireducens TaxID=517719 RepID=A0A1I1LKQ4_9RHOB|nr:hypothetical protein [Pseudooceanicola nitratireducens]SEJ64006.1 hypothetical protein SAMN05216183_104216 [Pseudooceanicola nitratireducens]SFC73777.1 hypothetical protein SAMN05421762_2010 [Pseudooceanicola nitratireducens]